MERKIYNPIQQDQVIFLKTHADTAGEYTLVEVELADGGGVGLHYQKLINSWPIRNSPTNGQSLIQEQEW